MDKRRHLIVADVGSFRGAYCDTDRHILVAQD